MSATICRVCKESFPSPGHVCYDEFAALREENARLEKLVNDTVFNREVTAITRALRQHFGVQDLLEENARLREVVKEADWAFTEIQNQACVCDGVNAKLRMDWLKQRCSDMLAKLRGRTE